MQTIEKRIGSASVIDLPDIDIDFADRSIILHEIKHRVAKLNTGKKHNTGVYANEIPHNPIDNMSTIDHKTAEERGYFKLDFLNVSIYRDVKDEAHLTQLMERIPLWNYWNTRTSAKKSFI